MLQREQGLWWHLLATRGKKITTDRGDDSGAEFLNLNTADIWGQLFGVRGCPVHCRTFNSIPGHYPLDSISSASSSYNSQKCLQTCSNIPWDNPLPLPLKESHYSRVGASGEATHRDSLRFLHFLKQNTKQNYFSCLQVSQYNNSFTDNSPKLWPDRLPNTCLSTGFINALRADGN